MKRFMIICLLLLAGCGGGSSSEADTPSAARPGHEIFEERILGPNPGCITCHSLDPETTLVGPPIAGVASRALSRVEGQRAEEYLRLSILEPSAYVVDGFDDGKMPADWQEVLSEAEITALVGYLLTLK
ncbi:MAG: cytochrome c [Acidimicrobiia bacterium]|nr:MAG: cytochrome c [Acidimicrobiia bacterium]